MPSTAAGAGPGYSSPGAALQPRRRAGEAVAQFINSFVTQAHRVRQPLEEQWRENWTNYRVEPYYHKTNDAAKMNPYADSSLGLGIHALKTPESHQVTNTLVSVILASLFGVRDYIEASPTGDEDIDKAKLVSRLTMWGLERPGNFRTNYDVLKDAVIFGTGAYRAGWLTKTRTVPRRMPVPDGQGGFLLNPETGRPFTVIQNVDVAVEDDFKLYPCNLWKLWFDPSHARLPDMDGVSEMWSTDKDTLAGLAGDPAWLQDGIGEVLSGEYGHSAMGPGDISSRPKLLTEELTDEDIKGIKEFGFCGGWRYCGRVPVELFRDAGLAQYGLTPNMTVQLATIGDSLVQAVQVPQRDGEIPYGTLTVLPNAETVYGLSPLTVIRYLQDVSDTQLILTVQAMIEAVYQNYVIGGGAGAAPTLRTEIERRKARQVFMVPGDAQQVQPLLKDYQGLSIAAQGLSWLSQTMRDASNARDPVQGIQNNDRSTATEATITSTAALQNVDQLSVLIERDELPREAELCYGAYYVHLDDEAKVIQRVGEDAPVSVSFWDIDGEYDLRFTGARQSLSKATKANQMRDFFQLMLSSPIGQASLDFIGFARMYQDEALDVRGLDRVIIADQEEVLARLQAQGVSGPIQGSGAGTSDAMAAQDAGEANSGA